MIESVDIEHYSIDKDHIYMIVKSLEEVSTEFQSFFINMIRIYQEREINTGDQKSKSLNKIGANGSIEGQI